MGDGWETKRSRQPAHKDWAILKLYARLHIPVTCLTTHHPNRGEACYLSHVVVDTAHFKGNFPQSCELHAINSNSDMPPHSASHSPPPTCYPSSECGAPTMKEDEWTTILPRVDLGPHREHYFQLDSHGKGTFTHVRLTIFPDGGVKRVRVFGSEKPTSGQEILIDSFERAETIDRTLGGVVTEKFNSNWRRILALPLTHEAFALFGQVIQSYEDIAATPRSIKVTPANFGTATKYHKLSLLESSYPAESGATTGISVYRCQPAKIVKNGARREIRLHALERHPYTNQAFLPMGHDKDKTYLVVVAKNGSDDRPDIGSLRAFVARADQGIVYNTGVWREWNFSHITPTIRRLNSTTRVDQPMTVMNGVSAP